MPIKRHPIGPLAVISLLEIFFNIPVRAWDARCLNVDKQSFTISGTRAVTTQDNDWQWFSAELVEVAEIKEIEVYTPPFARNGW